MSELSYWINVDKYSTWELIWNGVGCIFWVITYAALVIIIIKKKVVEMPFFIAAGNLAWEFVWSFFYHPDTGELYSLSYQGAFILDCYIFYHAYKYGHKLVESPEIKRHFKPILIGSLILWLPLNYLFVYNGFDSTIGSTSGYILNLFISILYPYILLKTSAKYYSTLIAWCKMLGTGFITISMFLIFPENYFVQVLGVFCFLLDSLYIYLLHKKKKELIST